jgi:hypothetical protein
LFIAQTALEHDAELLHNDRDFDVLAKVCGLKNAIRAIADDTVSILRSPYILWRIS